MACLCFGWLLEARIPFRSFDYQKYVHILFNLRFLMLIIPVNLGFGLLLVNLSMSFEHYQLGLFNQIDLPLSMQLIIAVFALDLVSQYGTHVMLHKLPWLWRLHMVHHSDTTMDTSTGTRHHPLDYICREISALLVVLLLGAPVVFYGIYRLATIFFTYFTHANINLPGQLDRVLSYVFITPNIHKFHHHHQQPWTDSNFGNIFSIWDRLFGTLVYEDTKNVRYGLDQLKAVDQSGKGPQFGHLLKLPFFRLGFKS